MEACVSRLLILMLNPISGSVRILILTPTTDIGMKRHSWKPSLGLKVLLKSSVSNTTKLCIANGELLPPKDTSH